MNDVLRRFQGVKGNGKQFTAKCPAHKDNHASLCIGLGDDRRILMKCQAGCETEDIVAAAGLTMKDLFQEPQDLFQEPKEKQPKAAVASYDYMDIDGKFMCRKVRCFDKSFGWRRRDERGKVVCNRSGVEAVLYNLPAFKQNQTIYVVEGEKDVETCKKHGIAAVCSPDGAGKGKWKWKSSFNQYFEGKHVIILNDNDEPGRVLATETANNLAGVAGSVKLIDILKFDPELHEHGDITDIFIKYGAIQAKALLALLEEQTPLHEPVNPVNNEDKSKEDPFELVSAAEIMNKEFSELVQPVDQFISEGLSFIVGAPKIGKSWVALLLAVNVAKGAPFWGRETTKSTVLYLALEDSQRRIQSRMRTMGIAEVPQNLFVATQSTLIGEGLETQLDNWLAKTKGSTLIIIDTFQRARGTAQKTLNAYQADYDTAGILKRIADKHRAAIVAVHHTNKLRNITDPYDKVSGSTGLMGAADTTILIDRQRDEDTATVQFTGRDVWGSDFIIRFCDGIWSLENENAEAYHSGNEYEAQPLTQLFCKLIAENPDGGRWSYEQLKAIGLELLGYYPFIDGKDCTRTLSNGLAAELRKRDNILAECGIKTNGMRGVKLQRIKPITTFQTHFHAIEGGNDEKQPKK